MGTLGVPPALAQAGDPPRRVARLGKVGGSVSFQPSNVQEFATAELNRPYTIGDTFWSGRDGRGELQTENAAIRFNGNTSLTLQDLSNEATQIKLASGTLSVRLHTLAPRESFEVDMPHRSLQLTRTGQYRMEIAASGDDLITVRFGQADAFSENGETESISQGMQARITGDTLHQHAAPAIDEFDEWCIKRDQREDASLAAHYVSRDLPGYADLDDNGAWRTLPNYGAVWFPNNMDPEWVPDRFGHFIQAAPWDAHWVEDKPWGFAPFHYGRWVNVHNEWGWIPPTSGESEAPGTQFAVRPYYTPALVAFAKFAPGMVQAGPVVGWFPLGPGEAWVPGFNASPNYLARVNLSNSTFSDRAVLDNPDVSRIVYANRDAMTAIPSDALASGQVVGKQFVHVPPDVQARAVVSAVPGVEFTREARVGPLGTAGAPPVEIANRTVVAHRLPPSRPTTSAPSVPAAAGRPGSLGQGLPRHSGLPGPNLTGHAPAAPAGGLSGKTDGVLGTVRNATQNATRSVGNALGIRKPTAKSKTGTAKATTAPSAKKPNK